MSEDHHREAENANLSLSPEAGSLFHFYHKTRNNSFRESGFEIQYEAASSYLFSNPRDRSRAYSSSGTKQRNDSYSYSSSRFQKYPSLEVTDHVMAEEEAEKHCAKSFHLKNSEDPDHITWTLPSSENLYKHPSWKDQKLSVMKIELNTCKGQLEMYEIENWHQHTYNCNPAQKIAYVVRNRARPELLTQAFLKFYEILHVFSIVPQPSSPDFTFRSLHLCEAPGAFVVALNHYLSHFRQDMKWEWMGNTLNPYYEGTPSSECISDDRFILFTLDNWYFGKDGTGNLMNLDYLAELVNHFHDTKKVHLVTADGSIDCQKNPAEQEATTHCLHFCEVYTAMCVLAEGGSLVLKKFTFFESESISILYFISCAFKDVFVHKPITSKLGNSEVYVVAVNYNPSESLKHYLNELRKFYGKKITEFSMFGKDQIPSTFLSRVRESANFFKNNQMEAIKRNIELYGNSTKRNEEYCNLLKACVLKRYLEDNLCEPIHQTQKLVQKRLEWDRNIFPEVTSLKWGGQLAKKPKLERIKFLNEQFDTLVSLYSKSFVVNVGNEWKTHEHRQECIFDKICITRGKPFNLVYVSRFCHTNLMQVYVQYFLECDRKTTLVDSDQQLSEFELNVADKLITLKKPITRQITNKIKKFHPWAVILNEGDFSGPHGKCTVLEEILMLIKDGKIYAGTDIAVLNMTLLTRLQVSMFFAVSSLFEKVVFYENVDFLNIPPFIVFCDLLFATEKDLIGKLQQEGSLFEKSLNQVHQLLPLQIMITSSLHPIICKYNALQCLSNIQLLKETQISN